MNKRKKIQNQAIQIWHKIQTKKKTGGKNAMSHVETTAYVHILNWFINQKQVRTRYAP
jgi:hypothetical protein